MSNKVSFYTHRKVDSSVLKAIVELKMQHWPHPSEAQFRWMNENINSEDVHVCVFDLFYQLIAYLNLVEVRVTGEQEEWNMIGIGNVCVDKLHLGKGLGLEIMQSVNAYLKENSRTGLLLCRKELEGFYLKAGWLLYNGPVMLLDKPYDNLVFSTVYLKASQLNIERNF